MKGSAVVEAEGIGKRFGDFVAVRDLTFRVHEGEILALLGPNGAGKTTTVRMLASVLAPTWGRARIAGFDVVKDSRQARRSVGLLTEFPGLYLRMTAWEYLDFYGELYRLPSRLRRERIESLLRRFGMWEYRDRRLGEYSKGMRQKLALARAMLHEPAVLLLDEPTSAMDPESAKMVREAIAGLREERRTAIICTHNLYEAETLADRVAIINQGHIVALGTVSELKERLLGPPVWEIRLGGQVSLVVEQAVGVHARVVSVGGRYIRYRTDEPEETNPAIIRALTQMGVRIIHLREIPWTLEDVYLKAVKSYEG